jgi:hypothetical protein
MKPRNSFVSAVGVGAFISGIALVTVAMYLGGFLAAITIPRSYFDAFGGGHRKLALAVLDGFAVALPFFLLSFAWCWLTLRAAVTTLKVAAWCCVAGIGIGLAVTEVQSALTLRTLEAMPNPSSFFSSLWRVLPPMRALPDLLAFPAGLIAAVWFAQRARISRKGHPSITQTAV